MVGRRAFLRASTLLNAGSGVECPCCGRRFRRFARFSGVNDQCPACGSLMRHRAIQLYMRDTLAAVPAGGSVLHVAPERALGQWLAALESVEYVSVDLESPLALVHADLTELPFEDDSFDLIVCAHVLEHVQDDRRAIGELFRVLRPGGFAIVQVPIHPVPETIEDPTVTSPAERQRALRSVGPRAPLRARLRGKARGGRLRGRGSRPRRAVDEDARKTFGLRPGEPFFVCGKAA